MKTVGNTEGIYISTFRHTTDPSHPPAALRTKVLVDAPLTLIRHGKLGEPD